LIFYDPDHLQLELVEVTNEDKIDSSNIWSFEKITASNAIIQFYSATLRVSKKSSVESVITAVLGYTQVDSIDSLSLFTVSQSSRAQLLEVEEINSTNQGVNAAGTVHHIAFRSTDEKEQDQMRTAVEKQGLYPTNVIDRFYFKSVYFRTHAGILFELATDGPGFTADQSIEDLGSTLSLPPFLHPFRAQIENNLPKLQIKKS
jgi:glyoxalase family protein